MNASRLGLAALALTLGGSVALFAQDAKPEAAAATPAAATAADSTAASEPAAPATADAGAAAKSAKSAKVRLTKPWRDLSSLSDDQKQQIAAIHRKAVQEIKQIEQREREAILALLNDGQKAEVQAMTEKSAAERKAKKPAAGPAPAAKAGAEPTDGEE